MKELKLSKAQGRRERRRKNVERLKLTDEGILGDEGLLFDIQIEAIVSSPGDSHFIPVNTSTMDSATDTHKPLAIYSMDDFPRDSKKYFYQRYSLWSL